jgi:hypothetical protein
MPPVERFSAGLWQFHAIVVRYDKTTRSFLAAIDCTASAIWRI